MTVTKACIEEKIEADKTPTIIERNKFDPVVKKKKDIAYLVDLPLLEKDNA